MPVHKLAAQGSLTTSKIDYPSMLAGYGDFGAMTRIASTVLSSNASNLTAFNISGTFQDLFMVCSLRAVNAAATSNVYFAIGNGTPDGGSNYSLTLLRGDGGRIYRALHQLDGWADRDDSGSQRHRRHLRVGHCSHSQLHDIGQQNGVVQGGCR